MLRFHCESCAKIIFFSTFHYIFRFHKITAVKLKTRFLGVYLHLYTAHIAGYYSYGGINVMLVQNKIVVIPLTVFQLLVIIFYS